MPDGTTEQSAALNEQQRLSCDGRRAAAVVRARAGFDIRALAPHLRALTLVLHSKGDLVVSSALGHELAASIPGACFEALRSRNHIPMAPEPAFERICEAVTAFVCEPVPAPLPTSRERELAGLAVQGLDILLLAARLGLAEKTVRNMVSLLYTKLGVCRC